MICMPYSTGKFYKIMSLSVSDSLDLNTAIYTICVDYDVIRHLLPRCDWLKCALSARQLHVQLHAVNRRGDRQHDRRSPTMCCVFVH